MIDSSSQAVITNINQKSLNKIKIPIPHINDIPDIETQKKYVSFFNKVSIRQNKLLRYDNLVRAQIEELKQSALQKAFIGELVKR